MGSRGGRVSAEAGAGLDDLADEDADDEGEAGDDLEVNEGFDADATDLLEVAHGGDAVDDGAEDDGGDHHADEADEGVTEPFEGFGEIRGGDAQDDGQGDGDQDLDIKDLVPGCFTTGTRPGLG